MRPLSALPKLSWVISLLVACALASLPAGTHAQQVQRCIGPDGRAVYTDRRCDDIGAVDRLPSAAAADGPRLFRGGCPRVLSQLVGEIGAAIQTRDVNRLAGIYDWRGMSDASASRVLDRLEGVVERPLVDIAPVYPYGGDGDATSGLPAAAVVEPSPPAATGDAPPAGPAAWMPSWSTAPASGPEPVAQAESPTDATPPPAPPTRPRPVALRIEQTLAGSATPVRTVFGLRRNYGCFWIAL